MILFTVMGDWKVGPVYSGEARSLEHLHEKLANLPPINEYNEILSGDYMVIYTYGESTTEFRIEISV